MIVVKYSDKAQVIDILRLAFEENKSVSYIIGQPDIRGLKLKRLIDYSFNVCYAYGKVVLSDDKKACALIMFPDKKKSSLKMLYWDFKLVFGVIGVYNIFRILKRESLIKKQHPSGKIYYLWYIGVSPIFQKKGEGSHLLKELIADAEALQRPIYLETSTLNNIPWYKKLGFEIFHEIDLGYNLFFMRR